MNEWYTDTELLQIQESIIYLGLIYLDVYSWNHDSIKLSDLMWNLREKKKNLFSWYNSLSELPLRIKLQLLAETIY